MKSLFNTESAKRILISSFVIIISSCFPMPNHGVDFCLHNTSEMPVAFFFPSKEGGYLTGWYDYLSEVSPLDTTAAGYQKKACCLGNSVKAGEIENIYSTYDFDELFQYDTIKVFVIKGDDMFAIDWGKDVLVRYDISYNDASYLLNDDGALELSYPPDTRMKNVKMWPKYEDVIRMSENYLIFEIE